MYSKNDYRYYLERRLAKSDDFLAHYGVKGMKWHKKKVYDESQYLNDKESFYSEKLAKNGDRLRTKHTYTTYGKLQKKRDMNADKKQFHKHINKTNPYKFDKNKSLKKNIQNTIKTSKERRNLKKISDKTVERHYQEGPNEKKNNDGRRYVYSTKTKRIKEEPKRKQTFGKMSKRDKELTKIGREVAREMNAKKPKKTYHEAVYDKKTKSYKLVKRNG